jgi:hypothetical protein
MIHSLGTALAGEEARLEEKKEKITLPIRSLRL